MNNVFSKFIFTNTLPTTTQDVSVLPSGFALAQPSHELLNQVRLVTLVWRWSKISDSAKGKVSLKAKSSFIGGLPGLVLQIVTSPSIQDLPADLV